MESNGNEHRPYFWVDEWALRVCWYELCEGGTMMVPASTQIVFPLDSLLGVELALIFMEKASEISGDS